MQRFVKAGRQADLYGTRTEEPLVRFFDKEDLPDCIDAVRSHIARTEGLDRLELHGDATDDLALSDCRAVRIYGRRTGASAALVEPLAGGLSDSRTLKVALKDSAGDSTGTVVIKLGDLRRVTREARRYEQLAARLPVGLGAHILYVVQAGAGRRGALVYQLADEHSQSLFSLLQRGESAALRATDRLTERLQAWVADAPEVPRTLIDLRRPLIADLALRNAHVPIPLERDVDLVVREAMAHGDLHGLNILVNHRGEPTLIDYGEVRRANAALDPVTLELSVVYHPAMAGRLGGWPTEDQARSWPDLDTYCGGCPVEDFVRKCRSWAYAVSSGEREVLATAYAYSMRQMKYAEATRPVALAVAASAYATLTA